MPPATDSTSGLQEAIIQLQKQQEARKIAWWAFLDSKAEMLEQIELARNRFLEGEVNKYLEAEQFHKNKIAALFQQLTQENCSLEESVKNKESCQVDLRNLESQTSLAMAQTSLSYKKIDPPPDNFNPHDPSWDTEYTELLENLTVWETKLTKQTEPQRLGSTRHQETAQDNPQPRTGNMEHAAVDISQERLQSTERTALDNLSEGHVSAEPHGNPQPRPGGTLQEKPQTRTVSTQTQAVDTQDRPELTKTPAGVSKSSLNYSSSELASPPSPHGTMFLSADEAEEKKEEDDQSLAAGGSEGEEAADEKESEDQTLVAGICTEKEAAVEETAVQTHATGENDGDADNEVETDGEEVTEDQSLGGGGIDEEAISDNEDPPMFDPEASAFADPMDDEGDNKEADEPTTTKWKATIWPAGALAPEAPVVITPEHEEDGWVFNQRVWILNHKKCTLDTEITFTKPAKEGVKPHVACRVVGCFKQQKGGPPLPFCIEHGGRQYCRKKCQSCGITPARKGGYCDKCTAQTTWQQPLLENGSFESSFEVDV